MTQLPLLTEDQLKPTYSATIYYRALVKIANFDFDPGCTSDDILDFALRVVEGRLDGEELAELVNQT